MRTRRSNSDKELSAMMDDSKLALYAKISLVVLLIALSSMLMVSIINLGDHYECEESTKTQSSCAEYRYKLNCKTKVATPINVALKVTVGRIKVNYHGYCAWDAPLSEVRIAFVFVAFVMIYTGYMALSSRDKLKANIYVYGSLLLAMLMWLSAFCDYTEILDSQRDNENLCQLKGKFAMSENIQKEFFECNFSTYYWTVGLSFFIGCLILLSSYIMNKWNHSNITYVDDLQLTT